ncbi:MAG: M23 family metallopeptidase [Crocinitomicaceae bacterium]
MNTPLSLIFTFFLVCFQLAFAQTATTKKYHPPLSIPLVLSANFGELRPNHFHMGLDFKTEAREGLTIHSIDEGYVSRVNVSPYGYGRTVYINHPGGITSVYAHCQRLTDKLEKRVKELQNQAKNSETDMYFQPLECKLERGEIFALSGNTGASGGPHLHFEIRDTYTEEALNPLRFGFDLIDTRAPSVFSIKAFALDESGYLIDGKSQEWTIKNGTIGAGTVTLPANFCSLKGGIGFAINGIDRFNAAENSCGIYGSRMIVNGDTLMVQELDQVAFEQTRYLNAYTDYPAFSKGKKYHKSFHSVINPLSVYKKKSLGILYAKPAGVYQIQYDTYDFSGNTTRTYFTLEIAEGEMNLSSTNAFVPNFLNPSENYTKEWPNCILEIPKGCTYEPIPKDISFNGSSLFFRSSFWPVQEAFTVKLRPLNEIPIQKQYLAVNKGGNWSALETNYFESWLVGKSKYFGEITVKVDDKAPSIIPVNIKPIIDKNKTTRLVWKMGDYQTGLANYGIEIDGKWQVLDYESKGDFAFYEISNLDVGIHELVVLAIDYAGNKNEWKQTVEIK